MEGGEEEEERRVDWLEEGIQETSPTKKGKTPRPKHPERAADVTHPTTR